VTDFDSSGSGGGIKGNEKLPAKAVVTIGTLDFTLEINGQIDLE
jgi:hypothetical protein